jgi:hypothetical protein
MSKILSIFLGTLMLLAFALVPVIAQEGPDEWEPNDDMELADTIEGYIIEAEIGDDDDEDDWFKLEGQEGYHPTFTIYFDEDELEVDWEIWSDDDIVGDSYDWGAPESITADVPGTCYIHVWWWSGEGEYSIEIEPDEDDVEPLDDDCEGPDELEPNDDEDLADSIDSLFIEGYACEDDDDWFVLEGQEGRNPEITLRYDEDECDIDLEIYSDDEWVGSLSNVDSPDSDDFRVPDVCYIHVYAYEGEGWYEIEIEP